MADILKEVLKKIPEGKISESGFEGANIVLYTKDGDFFRDNKGMIREIVNDIKKRVELRADPSILLSQEKTKKIIKELIPEEANISDIIFDSQRSILIIHAEKPGIAIGKQGSILKEIREKTLWIPQIKRTPAIRSKIIEDIRAVLYENSDYRKKFLNKVGERIYNGWLREKKHEWVRITQLGAGRQVGRSSLLLQTPESRILLDCGIDVAAEGSEQYPFLEAPEFKINEIDAVVITHAHIDHSGLVPWLFKMGYRGPVYCTAPTRDIMSLLLLDTIKIMRNYKGKDPLFEMEHLKEMVKHTITLDYNEVTDITPDIRITLYNAGHILGSAMVHVHIGNGLHNLLYTGDIKFGKTHLLSPAETKFPRLETMIIEGTYGGKDDYIDKEYDSDEHLRDTIKKTLSRGGKVLMPVLGSGRAQEIMVAIYELIEKGELEEIPVFIDGIVWDITAIYTGYPEFLKRSIRNKIFHKNENFFLSPIFKRVGSAEERRQVLEETGPCVIMATSGMLIGGPSVEYLKHLATNEKNTLVFTCYQGEGSLGRAIQQGISEITFKNGDKNEIIPIKMEVERVEITGHSDRRQLMAFALKCDPKPKKILINHCDNNKCLDLASSLHQKMKVETMAPKNLETIRLK